jgi:hypothetical protein
MAYRRRRNELAWSWYITLGKMQSGDTDMKGVCNLLANVRQTKKPSNVSFHKTR